MSDGKWSSFDSNGYRTVTPDVSKATILETKDKYVTEHIKVLPMSSGTQATCTVAGGGLSGGGLTAGSGEVATVTQGIVTPSVGGTGVNSTSQSSYGVTTTQPSGTDGTNYVTFDPGASITTNNVVHGRGTVNRAAVARAAITDAHTAGYLSAKSATTVIAADSTTIGATSGTSNWSSNTNSNPTIAAGTNYYVPISTATVTAGSATASASIAKQPSASTTASSASTTVTGLTNGTYSTTTTSSYYITASATSGSASAASGYSTASASATGGSASISKGITAGANASASASGTKSATSTEVTASSAAKTASSTIYLVKASTSISSGTATATATAGTTSSSGISDGISSSATSYYVTATGGSASSSVTASSATVGAGYNPSSVTASTTAASKSASGTSSTIYLKASTTTTSLDTGNMSTYFSTGSSSSNSVTLTPKYTRTAGYATAVTTATNNGGTSYWTIKKGTISSGSTNQTSYTQDTTSVPSDGYLYISEGWYSNTQISLASLIPDSTATDAASGQILYGLEAFNTSGTRLVGTIKTAYLGTAVSDSASQFLLSSTYYTTTNTGFGAEGAGYLSQTYYIKAGAYSVTCAKTNPSVAYTKSTNMTTASSGTYYFTYGGTVTNGTHTATATIGTAGWISAGSKSTTAEAIGVSVSGAGTVYIPTAAGSVTMTAGSGVLTKGTGITTATSDTYSCGFSLSGKGSVSATAKITTAGYTPTNTSFATGASTSSNASTTEYITQLTIPASATFGSSSSSGVVMTAGTSTALTGLFLTNSNYNNLYIYGTATTASNIYLIDNKNTVYIGYNNSNYVSSLYLASNASYTSYIGVLSVGNTTSSSRTTQGYISTLYLRGYNTNTSYPDYINTLYVGYNSTYNNAKITTLYVNGYVGTQYIGSSGATSRTNYGYVNTLTIRGQNTNTSYPDYINTLNVGTSTTYMKAKINILNLYGTIGLLRSPGLSSTSTVTSTSKGVATIYSDGTATNFAFYDGIYTWLVSIDSSGNVTFS